MISFILKPLYRQISKRSFGTHNDIGIWNPVIVGNISPERFVPNDIHVPSYYYSSLPPGNNLKEPEIKTSKQIAGMQDSCKLAANILNMCNDILRVGVTTDEVDKFVHEKIISAKAYPSPLRYNGFPKSICTSVNNVACHGIPDDRPLQNGDILNIDVTVFLNGFHGDCSKTFAIGDVDNAGIYLIKKTEKCLLDCISLCKPNVDFNNIGNCIHDFCIDSDLTVIPAFIGHGIGSYFHGPPEILHFKNKLSGKMLAGMTFTIEPILTLGGPDVEILDDGWTAVTVDGSRSAQFEHTVLITEVGNKILTLPD